MAHGEIPPVLMYHSVGPNRQPSPWAVTVESFAAQMRWLRKRGLKGVAMRELFCCAEGRCSPVPGWAHFR
jgi:hypothetical protein